MVTHARVNSRLLPPRGPPRVTPTAAAFWREKGASIITLARVDGAREPRKVIRLGEGKLRFQTPKLKMSLSVSMSCMSRGILVASGGQSGLVDVPG